MAEPFFASNAPKPVPPAKPSAPNSKRLFMLPPPPPPPRGTIDFVAEPMAVPVEGNGRYGIVGMLSRRSWMPCMKLGWLSWIVRLAFISG